MFESWGIIGLRRLQSESFRDRLQLILGLLIACKGCEIERIVQSKNMDMNRPFQRFRSQQLKRQFLDH
ncbi:hypothetical protein A3197_01010 [Candidatus Thiodiazotropha endoloripes]|nr:hypothetical protein A3197_01010 [Candidatus Thiodiazotropha endoloripes]